MKFKTSRVYVVIKDMKLISCKNNPSGLVLARNQVFSRNQQNTHVTHFFVHINKWNNFLNSTVTVEICNCFLIESGNESRSW